MKTFIKSTSRLVVLASLLLPTALWAKSFGRVSEIKGHAFIIVDGATKVLAPGDEIPKPGEVITEEGSQVTFSDFNDHLYHLSGSGQMAFSEKDVELRRGYLWVQSFNSYNDFQVKTANALTTFRKSDFIVSFDNVKGRTQVLSVSGKVDLSNLLETNLVQTIDSGNFSFVDLTYEEGAPRKPTMIGYKSYEKVVGLFGKVKPLDPSAEAIIRGTMPKAMAAAPKENSNVDGLARELASVSGMEIEQPKKSKKMISKMKGKEKKIAEKKVVVYGLESEIMETLMPTLSERKPSSIQETQAAEKKVQNDFEQSLNEQVQKQPRHTGEVNHLIDELKSYSNDYQKEY
jgi:hypothetical protein